MRQLRAVALSLFLPTVIPGLLFPQTKEIQVWAIGGGVRVDPISCRTREDNPALPPASRGEDYKSSNLIWSAENRLVKLRAARNEIVSYQIIAERTGEANLTNVSVDMNEFRGPAGAVIPADNVDLYKEWYVQLKQKSARIVSLGAGWYPDALLPTRNWEGELYPSDYVLPFDIPDVMNNIGEEQRSQALWVDVYVPRGRKAAPPGSYTSTVTVSSDAGTEAIAVQLDVWDFELPDETHLF